MIELTVKRTSLLEALSYAQNFIDKKNYHVYSKKHTFIYK